MEYFTRKAFDATQTPQGRKAWLQLEKDYAAHLRSINPVLKDGWRALASQDLSEETIEVAERPSFDQVTLELENQVIVFRGVRQARLPERTGEAVSWVSHEVHIGEEDAVELKVLLSEGELRITADEVNIYNSEAGEYRRTG